MAIRTGEAFWRGDLKHGEGRVKYGRKPIDQPYSFTSRFEQGEGTNPEELIAAAHAACFSMALAHAMSEAGHAPEEVRTTAKVYLEKGKDGFSIPRIDLQTTADVTGIEERDFRQHAEQAKKNCPVSRLFAGAKITLEAKLVEPSPLGSA
jgi:osmotically inducible protein OsmC